MANQLPQTRKPCRHSHCGEVGETGIFLNSRARNPPKKFLSAQPHNHPKIKIKAWHCLSALAMPAYTLMTYDLQHQSSTTTSSEDHFNEFNIHVLLIIQHLPGQALIKGWPMRRTQPCIRRKDAQPLVQPYAIIIPCVILQIFQSSNC